jgi:hypothetical protein
MVNSTLRHASPRKRVIFRGFCGLVGINLLLWTLTWVWGVRGIRAFYDSFPTEIQLDDLEDPRPKPLTVVRLDSFDPDVFRHPGDGRVFYYFGRLRSPCPFVVSLDVAVSHETGGEEDKLLIGWWFGRMKLLRKETSWAFGDAPVNHMHRVRLAYSVQRPVTPHRRAGSGGQARLGGNRPGPRKPSAHRRSPEGRDHGVLSQ